MSDSIEQLIERIMAIDTAEDAETVINSFEFLTGIDETNIGFVDIVNFMRASIEATRTINDKVNLLIELEQRRQEENNV